MTLEAVLHRQRHGLNVGVASLNALCREYGRAYASGRHRLNSPVLWRKRHKTFERSTAIFGGCPMPRY